MKKYCYFISIILLCCFTYGTVFSSNQRTPSKIKSKKHFSPALQKGAATSIFSGPYFVERFEGNTFPPAGWTIINDDEDLTWEKTFAGSSYGIGEASVVVKFYDYWAAPEYDTLLTPIITGLTGTSGSPDSIVFDIAYAKTTFAEDSLYVMLSTDSGRNFNHTVFQLGPNEMKTSTTSNFFTPNSGQWKTLKAPLPPSVDNNKCVFAFVSVYGGDGNNLYLDDIRIGDIPNVSEDLYVQPVILINEPYVIGKPLTIQATVTSIAPPTSPPATVTLTYKENSVPTSINDGVTETFSTPSFLWGGSPRSILLQFSSPYTPTTAGEKELYVRVFYNADDDQTNDTYSKKISVTHYVSRFPYMENFDSAKDSGWFTGAFTLSNDWQKGTPSKTQINSAYSPPNSWVTKLTGDYTGGQNSFVLSPVIDFRSLFEDPEISLYHNFKFGITNSFEGDGSAIEYSVNGEPFAILGTENDPNGLNWYNDNAIFYGGEDTIAGPLWKGSSTVYPSHSNGWINSKLLLQGFANIGTVQFRFRFGTEFDRESEGWAFDNVRIDFPFTYGTIAGTKYNDINGNGVFDGGEPGVPDWTIYLSKIVLSETTTVFLTTDVNGQYTFSGLKQGTYLVTEESKNGWVRTSPSNGKHSFQLSTGENKTGMDFGNFNLGSIGGNVFNDINANGIREPEESPLPFWQITIEQLDGTNDTTLYSDESGNFLFTVLPYGTYKVSELLQVGYARSAPDSSYTVIVYSGENITSLNFGNYRVTSIKLQMLDDADGSFETSYDRVVRKWPLKLYKNSIAPENLVESVNETSLVAVVNQGIYVAVQHDSARWIALGVDSNSIPTLGAFSSFTLYADSGTYNEISFVNFLPHTITIRTLEDYDGSFFGTPSDRAPKQWYMQVVGLETATDTFSLDSTLSVGYLQKGRYAINIADSAEWTHLGILSSQGSPSRTKRNTDTVSVGDGVDAFVTFVQWKMKPDTVQYRTFTQGQFTVKARKIKPSKKNLFPVPNFGNVRDTIFEKGVPKGSALLLGIQRLDSPKVFGWAYFQGGKGKGKNISKALPMTVTADSFKHKKAIKNPTLRKLNNKLAGELLLLRLNIIASDNGFTTPANQSEKFGDLFYEEPTDTGTPYYGKELREISAYFDSILTYGKRLTNVNYSQLASVAEKLNTAFASPDTITLNDTVSLYVGGFKLKGFKMMSEVPYLRRDLGIPPRAHSSAIIKDETPSVFSLEQNYPNPFNPNTTIRFSLPLDASVSLRVFDILGREVSSILQNEELEEGEYEFDFDATKLSSGVYFYKLSADNGKFNSIRRMLLLK